MFVWHDFDLDYSIQIAVKLNEENEEKKVMNSGRSLPQSAMKVDGMNK